MDNRKVFGWLCIFLNSYGVPCFLQKKVKAGILRIVLSMVTFGILGVVNVVKGIIVGIKVLKMTDEEYAKVKGTILTGIPAEK